MNTVVLTEALNEPPFCEKEILRYAGCRDEAPEAVALIRDCIDEIREGLTYKVCYAELSLDLSDGMCDFGHFVLNSEKLFKNLSGCERAVIFAATVGVQIDRIIAKYGRISPARALIFQAIGAERIEALCDSFCNETAQKYNMSTRPRFSPGYGDLPLSAQRDIFALLAPEKKLGLTLNDSLLMSPSKSVTAVFGLCEGKNKIKTYNKCSACNMRDCSFRGAL